MRALPWSGRVFCLWVTAYRRPNLAGPPPPLWRLHSPVMANSGKKPGPEPETLKIDLDPVEGLDRLLRAKPKPSPKPKRKRQGTRRKS